MPGLNDANVPEFGAFHSRSRAVRPMALRCRERICPTRGIAYSPRVEIVVAPTVDHGTEHRGAMAHIRFTASDSSASSYPDLSFFELHGF